MTRRYQMPPRYSSSKISLLYASPSPEVAITSPAEKITEEKLAQTAGVTPNHFLRLFHATFDTTPIAYLNRLRPATVCVAWGSRRRTDAMVKNRNRVENR